MTAQSQRTWADGIGGRVAVTLAALLVYRLGLAVPLPGIDQAAIAAMMRHGTPGLGIDRISLFTLGMVPLLTAYILAETLRLISPAMARWQAVPANDRLLHRWLRGLALVMAAFQGWGIAVAIEGIERVVAEPGWPFRVGVLATLLAATAVLSWLADTVTRRGVTNGFWLLAVTPTIADVAPRAAETLSLYRFGSLGDGAMIATAVYLALAVAALVGLHLARHDDDPRVPRMSVWPPVLAYTAMGWIAALLVGGGDPRQSWFGPGQAGYLVLLAILILLFALRDGAMPAPASASDIGAGAANRASAAGTGMGPVAAAAAARAASTAAAAEAAERRRVRIRLAGLVAAVQIAICVAGNILGGLSPMAIPGMWLIVAVAVALGILDAVGRPAAATPTS